MIAQVLVEGNDTIDPEEAFICSMVHKLGRFLTMFYLPEEYGEIEVHRQHSGDDEIQACRSVLGLSFADIGSAVAGEWGLPKSIIESMTPLNPGPVKTAETTAQFCAQVATFSNELCESIASDPPDTARLDALQRRFEKALSVSPERLTDIVKTALNNAKSFGPIVTTSFETSQVFQAISNWSAGGTIDSQSEPSSPSANTVDPESVVINGIQDISNALIENANLNEILSMILETVYRGLRFDRVVLCIADPRRNLMVARHGLGMGVETMVERFAFSINDPQDLFSKALRDREPLVFPRTGLVSNDLPAWYRAITSAPELLVLLPIVVGERAPGAIYCDVVSIPAGLRKQHFNYLCTLRNQAALAIKQQSMKS